MNDVQLVGLKEVMREFDFYEKETKKRLRTTVKEAARPVLADAKARLQSSVEPGSSGDLKRDLTIIAEKSKGEKYVVRVGQKRRSSAKAVNASGTPYGGMVEYGTSKTPAHNFMRGALEGNREAIQTRIIENILNEFLK